MQFIVHSENIPKDIAVRGEKMKDEKILVAQVRQALEDVDHVRKKLLSILDELENPEKYISETPAPAMADASRESSPFSPHQPVSEHHYLDMLKSLAADAGYIKKLWLSDDDWKKIDVKIDLLSGEEDIKLLKGQSLSGFRLGIIAAQTPRKEQTYFYLLEDAERKHLLVIGTEGVADDLKESLVDKNIHYVRKDDPSALDDINDFLIEGYRFRGSRNSPSLPLLYEGHLIEHIILTFAEITGNPMKKFMPGTTLGGLLTTAPANAKPIIHAAARG